jgi:hypothetical protein
MDMNDICELWSLPWHALQRDLAMGLAGEAARLAVPALRAVKVQRAVAVSTSSWQSRARQAAALTQVRPQHWRFR